MISCISRYTQYNIRMHVMYFYLQTHNMRMYVYILHYRVYDKKSIYTRKILIKTMYVIVIDRQGTYTGGFLIIFVPS